MLQVTRFKKAPPATGLAGGSKFWIEQVRKHIPVKKCLAELASIAFESTTFEFEGVKVKKYLYETKDRLRAIETMLAKTLPDLKSVEVNATVEPQDRTDFATLAIAVAAIQEAQANASTLPVSAIRIEANKVVSELVDEAAKRAVEEEDPFELIDSLDEAALRGVAFNGECLVEDISA